MAENESIKDERQEFKKRYTNPKERARETIEDDGVLMGSTRIADYLQLRWERVRWLAKHKGLPVWMSYSGRPIAFKSEILDWITNTRTLLYSEQKKGQKNGG